MSELEEKLGSILNDPQMMQQIMTMAQALSAGHAQKEESFQKQKKPESMQNASNLDFDPKILQGISGLLKNRGVDQNQLALLHALSPYLSHERINKLERAMQAARMAGAASVFLNSGGLQMLAGR